jgi:hypothetical protein
MRVSWVALVALIALSACSSLPATHVVLPSPKSIVAMDKLSQMNGAVATVITVDGEEQMVFVERGEPGTLAGTGLVDPMFDRQMAWPYDSLALIYYTDPASAKLDPMKRLPVKDRYPELAAAGELERGLSCAQLDTELARAEALRLVARSRGATPYTTGEKSHLHVKHAAQDVGAAAAAVLLAPWIAGAAASGAIDEAFSPVGHSGPRGVWAVDLEGFRWAVSATDERIDGLLKIKDQKSCAGRTSLQVEASDLQLWRGLRPDGTDPAAASSDEHAWVVRRTAVFDQLGPKAVALRDPDVVVP